MKKLIIALLGLVMLALVGACGGVGEVVPSNVNNPTKEDGTPASPDTPYDPEAPAAAENEPTDPPAAAAPMEDPTNKRGNIEFDIGEEMGLQGPSGETIATITVTGLEFITCQNVIGETGNPLVMSYTIETSADASRSDLGSVFNPFAMSLYDASTGLTAANGATMPVCFDKANELNVPVNLSPGSKYSGGILFPDAPESGAVIYTPSWSANGAEWSY